MTIKQGLRFLLFIVALGISAGAVVSVFGLPAEGNALACTKRYHSFYAEPEDTIDFVLLGTSSVDREWIAPEAWDKYGITGYALNTDVQPLVLATGILEEVRKTQDIKLAVVDVRGIRSSTVRPKDSTFRRVTDNMKYSKNRWDTIAHAIDYYKDYYQDEEMRAIEGEEEADKMLDSLDEASLYFPFLKYHSRWSEGLTRDDFITPYNTMKGVYNVENMAFTVEAQDPTEVVGNTKELNGMQTRLLDEIMAYGKDTGLEILFIVSPSKLSKGEQTEFNAAAEYLQEHGANVINFNKDEYYAAFGMDFSQDLYNAHHMNSRGGVKFTRYFAKYLSETYQLADKRGQEGYESWDEAYEKFVKFYKEGWAAQKKEAEEK